MPNDASAVARMPRSPSSRSNARMYTFSRNPAPRVFETSMTAPMTRSVRAFSYLCSSVFICGQIVSLVDGQNQYWPQMNADRSGALFLSRDNHVLDLVVG